jgi:hypothetical protein
MTSNLKKKSHNMWILKIKHNYKIKIFHVEWTIWHINIKIKIEKYYNIK